MQDHIACAETGLAVYLTELFSKIGQFLEPETKS